MTVGSTTIALKSGMVLIKTLFAFFSLGVQLHFSLSFCMLCVVAVNNEQSLSII